MTAQSELHIDRSSKQAEAKTEKKEAGDPVNNEGNSEEGYPGIVMMS